MVHLANVSESKSSSSGFQIKGRGKIGRGSTVLSLLGDRLLNSTILTPTLENIRLFGVLKKRFYFKAYTPDG